MNNFFDFTFEKLENFLIENGEKKFRAQQLYSWIYDKNQFDFDKMVNISLVSREKLQKILSFEKPKIVKHVVSEDNTQKLLVKFSDNSVVETVLMNYRYGNVACVSSQVGCNMGCTFCASGLIKKKRDLTPGEMVGQVLLLNDLLREKNEMPISHVVVMGTGEPFDNFDNVVDFLKIINHPHGLGIGARHLTVSTCGIPSKIREFAHIGIQAKLAISLHAATNEKRDKLMPINRAFPLEEVIDAVKYFEKVTNKRTTFEYILLKDVNDSLEDAKNLVELIKGTLAFVNIIPYNEVSENAYKRSSKERIDAFRDYLMKNGVNVNVRKEFGRDIDAACGQLRAKNVELS
ncbi:MAG: 23S rRNA (adenine(2503)-C(2))-methyltransferase RlmN [Bacilli bacterium]|jgi:23S rRNA (adenine2503-C2)-methyltransferase